MRIMLSGACQFLDVLFLLQIYFPHTIIQIHTKLQLC